MEKSDEVKLDIKDNAKNLKSTEDQEEIDRRKKKYNVLLLLVILFSIDTAIVIFTYWYVKLKYEFLGQVYFISIYGGIGSVWGIVVFISFVSNSSPLCFVFGIFKALFISISIATFWTHYVAYLFGLVIFNYKYDGLGTRIQDTFYEKVRNEEE